MDFKQLYLSLVGQQHKAVLAAVLLYIATNVSPADMAALLAQTGVAVPVTVITPVLALLGAVAVWLVPNIKPTGE